MIAPLIRKAFDYRWVVLLVSMVIAIAGAFAFRMMKIEAYPDISGVSVTVVTTFPGRAPEEVERQITAPIEMALGNTPSAETIRSRTIFGLSVIQVSFEEGSESYWARQRIQERLSAVDLPKGANAQLAPMISAAGEICRYQVVGDGTQSLMDLRTIHDWVIVPRLLRVAGIGDVSNFGGDLKQFVVSLQPQQLHRAGVSLTDVANAIRSNNNTSGGSVITRGSMSFVVRGRGAVQSEKEIGSIFVKSVEGSAIYLRDIAEVRVESKLPTGIFGKDDNNHAIEGLVTMRKGENPTVALDKLKEAVKELNENGLPPGVKLEFFYDRSTLIDTTFETVAHSVGMGVGLVVLVLLFFLGSPRLAGLVALAIPFSLLFALVLMYIANIPIGLLSIGAIDFGIIVDGAVIMAENIATRLGHFRNCHDKAEIRGIILKSALEVQRPVFFAVLMIIAVHLPLLTLVRIEGLLFRPMAITIVFALLGCLMFALVVVPVLASFFFVNGFVEWENPLLRLGKPLYERLIRFLVRTRWVVAPVVFVVLGSAIFWVAQRLGTEFLPYMDEGVVWVRANFPEGTSLEQTADYANEIRGLLREFKDIAFVTSRSGRTDSGLDPFPPSRIEFMVGPKPREQWKEFNAKSEMLAAMGNRLRIEFPTTRFNITQPIIDSVTEETNGTSANLAVEFTGHDVAVMQVLGRQTVNLLKKVPGAEDVSIEQEGPQPQLAIEPDRALCARYNVRIEDVNTLVNTALGGEPVGNLFEGERVFEIAVKYDRARLSSPQAVARLPVFAADGTPVPLGQVAKIEIADGQTLIAREGSRRRVTVRCDIVGRDQGGFVAEAQRRFAEEIEVPAGYRAAWIGMFENLARARGHFAIVGPITVAVLFMMLTVTLGSLRGALSILFALPFAFVGGAFAIYLRGMNLNVSVGVGFAALFGVSIMNGVLIVQRIANLRARGEELEHAIVRGASDSLRPILMASLVAMLGLLPASFATGLGSDVQRPLATVIVWGLFSSTAMTLFMVPVLYRIFLPPAPKPETIAAH
ncbi:MAG: CusA/CzcA family heavy metal efflux RND transporter [Gemmataceae bacterium]|nr:CusA/CzcA family heavy metal efflux RND transporter [Gemmataceae bacterium]